MHARPAACACVRFDARRSVHRCRGARRSTFSTPKTPTMSTVTSRLPRCASRCTCSGRMPTKPSAPSPSASCGSFAAATTFMLGVPINCATNRLAGLSYSASGAPCCSIRHRAAPHAVGQRHRLDLVVRDIDGGGAQFTVQPGRFRYGSAPAARRPGSTAVRRTGTLSGRARWRGQSPRAGAARRTDPGVLFEVGAEIENAAALCTLARMVARSTPASFSANDMFSEHRHVRVQRVGLEHHGQVALRRPPAP